MSPEPVAVTVQKASELVGLNVTEIYAAVHSGELPASRRGRRILIDYAALLGWFRSFPKVGDDTA